MKKIVAFFANMPKVTGLIQGLLDMMAALVRILPMAAAKMDSPQEAKARQAIERTISLLNLGVDKTLRMCRYLGLKVERRPSGAMAIAMKHRFDKDRKDFIEYEVDELNRTLDSLDKVDEEVRPIPPGPLPPDVSENNLYPQRMKLRPDPMPPPSPPESSESSLQPEIPKVHPDGPGRPPIGANGIR